MKKIRKILSLLLVVVLALGAMFSGCSSGDNSNVSSKSSPESGGDGKNELKPYEIVLGFSGNESKDTNLVAEKMSEITKKKINATVKILSIPGSVWAQQTNLMLASNEQLDLMYLGSYQNHNNVIARGQVIPLEGLLEKYGQDIKKVLDKDALSCGTIAGHLYGIPSIRDFAGDAGLVMRKDMVEKYNININSIKSIKDFTPIFKKIKENEPDYTPVAISSSISRSTIELFMEYAVFDKLDNWMGVMYHDDDKYKVLNYYESKEYEEVVNLFREWFLAGYISKDAATIKESAWDLLKADKAFSTIQAMKPGYAQQSTRMTGHEMVTVSVTPAITSTNNVSNFMTAITKNSKDPDRAMMFLNMLYSDKQLINLFANGIEGTHYVKNSDGTISFPTGVDGSNTRYSPINYYIGNGLLTDLWKGEPLDLWSQMDKYNKSSKKTKALGFSFNTEPVKTEIAAINNVIAQYKVGLDTGTLDPKVTLPEYRTKLKAAGLDKVIAEKQKQLDEWVKTKNK